jgi:putative spermidine/putrescine transport system substrate-binding protein
MSKKKFVLFVTMVIILVLSACSPQATVAPTTVPPTAVPATEVPPTDVPPAEVPATEVESPKLAESIVFVNPGGDWGDCMRKSFSDTFTEKYGVKVIDAPFMDDGQIRAAVESGVYDADVVWPTPSFALDALGSQYLEPIDFSIVPKDELIEGTYTNYAVAVDLFAWAFGYRTDVTPAPTKWSDFFDTTTFPGKRGLVSWDYSTVLIGALLADGVAPDQLVPLDIERAFKKLDTIKEDIVWFDTGSAGQDLLVSGEVRFVQLYANRITTSRGNGDPVDIIWDGQIIQSDYVGIPKGSPNVATAMQYIAHMVSKEINGQFSFCQPAAPSNAQTTVNTEIAADLPTSHLDVLHVISSSPEIASYFEEHIDEITDAFNNWKGSSE